MRNVRRWMVWLLQAQYCKDYKWDTNRLGGWMEVLGLPADLDIPVTEEHLRVLKPVFNKDDADPVSACRTIRQATLCFMHPQHSHTVSRTNHAKLCPEQSHPLVPNRPIPQTQHPTQSERKLGRNGQGTRLLERMRMGIPRIERYYNPIRLLRDEYRRGGLPETFHYPIHTTKGEYRWRKEQSAPTQQSSSTASP